MASGSQAAADGGTGRSGGKILTRRRTSARNTPYDRPTPPPQRENPNWLNGLVFPAKFVAGGASKLLSSFWNPKSRGSPSSSSNGDSDSEDDSEGNEDLSDEVVELGQKKGSSSGKHEILHLVEQLLMLERYSREECDRLIEIINSRVLDDTIREDMDAGPSQILSRTDIEMPDTRHQAILEAKKLLNEKMIGSRSKSDLDNGMHGSKSDMAPHIIEGEAGSPVDVAKSYMQTRPPWVSPISHSDPPTPAPFAADLLKEGTPYSSLGGNSFSSAKRDHLSAGSWNIQDEIRRLRSKATGDMLSNHQSTQHPGFAVEHGVPEQSVANHKAVEVIKLNESISLETPKPAAGTVNLALEGVTPGLSDTRTTQDDVPAKDLPSLPTIQEQNQMIEGQDATSNHNKRNPKVSGEEIDLEKEDNIGRSNERPNKDDKTKTGNDEVSRSQVNCDLITESPEIPDVNGSQDSSNTNNNPSSSRQTDSPTIRRVVTRSSRYTRRTRSQAK